MSRIVAAAAAALLVAFAAPVAADDSWDYLLYTARWAGTAAYHQELPENVTTFTLHGVWPTRNDGSWPSYCTQEAFSPSKIADLIPVLKSVWYDYQHASHYSFWTHEWSKHGTCALSDPAIGTQHGFFASAITMHKSSTIEDALSASSIVPDYSKKYRQGDVAYAIKSALGYYPVMTCENVNGLGNAIARVQLCYDKSLNIQECPSSLHAAAVLASRRGGCSSSDDTELYYPPIEH